MNAIAPHSLESEQSVIGGLLMDNNAIDHIESLLKPEHFYHAHHRTIFVTICELIKDRNPADAVTVYQKLQDKGRSEDVGGLKYLTELVSNTPSSANIKRYAQIVIDRWMMRELQALSNDLSGMVQAPQGKTVSEILESAAQKITLLSQNRSRREPVLLRDLMLNHVNQLDERSQENGAKKPKRRISTGLRDLDKVLNGGLGRGQVIIVAGRPAMGKSGLAMNICMSAGKAGYGTLFLSQEMPLDELADRAIASTAKVSYDRLLRSDQEDDGLWGALTHFCQNAGDWPIYFDDEPALTILGIQAKARAIKRKQGLDLLIVDYLQLCTAISKKDNRAYEIEEISRGLKALAKDLNIAVVALSQFNRDLERRADKRPMMSDLRDSGAIEQDADVIIGIYRDEVYHPDSRDKGTAELIIMKQRAGKTGVVRTAFQGEFTLFEDLSYEWTPAPEPVKSHRRGALD